MVNFPLWDPSCVSVHMNGTSAFYKFYKNISKAVCFPLELRCVPAFPSWGRKKANFGEAIAETVILAGRTEEGHWAACLNVQCFPNVTATLQTQVTDPSPGIGQRWTVNIRNDHTGKEVVLLYTLPGISIILGQRTTRKLALTQSNSSHNSKPVTWWLVT